MSKGKKYNKLLALEEIRREDRVQFWKFLCDCGEYKIARLNNVQSGNTTQCDSCRKKQRKEKALSHGMTGTLTYKSYSKMKERCLNSKDISYHRYGGKGIKVCGRWLESFENFLEDMGERPSKEFSLDRVNPNYGYFPSNCKWSTREEQNRNQKKQCNNSSGKTGVARRVCSKTGNISYVSRWYQDGKLKSRSFSVNNYGDELAFFAACEYRDFMIECLKERGAEYGELHGQ